MNKKIPEIPLIPGPLSEEGKKAVGYQWNAVAGIRHKLGGQPEGIEEKLFPVCESCGEKMTFYGQLDSIGENFDLADCGLILVFVCFDCFSTRSILTHTIT